MFAAKPLGFRLPGTESAQAQNLVYLAEQLTPPEPENTPRRPRIPPMRWRATRTGARAATSCRRGSS